MEILIVSHFLSTLVQRSPTNTAKLGLACTNCGRGPTELHAKIECLSKLSLKFENIAKFPQMPCTSQFGNNHARMCLRPTGVSADVLCVRAVCVCGCVCCVRPSFSMISGSQSSSLFVCVSGILVLSFLCHFELQLVCHHIKTRSALFQTRTKIRLKDNTVHLLDLILCARDTFELFSAYFSQNHTVLLYI